jgi:hypothetical protein
MIFTGGNGSASYRTGDALHVLPPGLMNGATGKERRALKSSKDSKKVHVWNVRGYKDGHGRVKIDALVSRHVQTCKEIEVSDSLDPQEGELGPLDFDDEASGRNLEVIASSDPQEEGVLKINKGLEEALSFAIATAAERKRKAKQFGSGKEEGTHVETIKGRLIRCHLRERPGEGFAVYWGALCKPEEYLRSFLESNGYQKEALDPLSPAQAAPPGEIVLIGPKGKKTKISKDSHARLFRLAKKRKNDR